MADDDFVLNFDAAPKHRSQQPRGRSTVTAYAKGTGAPAQPQTYNRGGPASTSRPANGAGGQRSTHTRSLGQKSHIKVRPASAALHTYGLPDHSFRQSAENGLDKQGNKGLSWQSPVAIGVRPGGFHGNRQLQRGGERYASGSKSNRKAYVDPDELEAKLQAADVGEAEDVAAMVSLMSRRDAHVEQELQRTTAYHAKDDDGIVEFGDDSDEADRKRAKRARMDGNGGSGTGGAPHAKGNSSRGQFKDPRAGGGSHAGNYGGTDAGAQTARFNPGKLIHAASASAVAAAGASGVAQGPTQGGASEWAGLGLGESVVGQLSFLKFERPTAVQRSTLPPMLEGRDVLVKAPTGSGKTLAYLLPIVQALQAMSPSASRADGTYAIVIVPTRELCIQIYDVAVALMRRFRWLVPGMLIGGENRGHEKARLRKGLTLVAASPGRLIDHLEQTSSFRTSELRWLVLDEADRLLDMGFRDKLAHIIHLLNTRSSPEGAAVLEQHAKYGKGSQGPKRHRSEGEEAVESEGSQEQQEPGSHKPGAAGKGPPGRQTALLSATLHTGLSDLASRVLNDPLAIGFTFQRDKAGNIVVLSNRGTGADSASGGNADMAGADDYNIPSQLRQSFMVVESKDRLVTLTGLLRSRLRQRQHSAGGGGSVSLDDMASGRSAAAVAAAAAGGCSAKVVVFVASCAEVDFLHYFLKDLWPVAMGEPLMKAGVYRLHGDMPQSDRTATFCKFCEPGDGLLICTDVAARGLDFPDVSTIVQYDVPGAPAEYVHRVGRTARMGASGEALLFLQPPEKAYVELLRTKGIQLAEDSPGKLLRGLATLVRSGGGAGSLFRKGGKGGAAAALEPTSIAMSLTRQMINAVLGDAHATSLAATAFSSFVRSYATFPSDLKHIFHVRNLHLGHIAFSFCLKEQPRAVGGSGAKKERKRLKFEGEANKAAAAKKTIFRVAQQLQDREIKPDRSKRPRVGL